MKEKCITFACS